MNKPIVIYDEARGKILAKYVENFGKFCEVDVTDQTLQAVFRYLMAYGLTLNENCEYEFDGDKVSNSLVKQEAPTIEPVKRGKWLYVDKHHIQAWQAMNKCGVCKRAVYNEYCGFKVIYFKYCPHCGAKMDGDGK